MSGLYTAVTKNSEKWKNETEHEYRLHWSFYAVHPIQSDSIRLDPVRLPIRFNPINFAVQFGFHPFDSIQIVLRFDWVRFRSVSGPIRTDSVPIRFNPIRFPTRYDPVRFPIRFPIRFGFQSDSIGIQSDSIRFPVRFDPIGAG